MPHPMPKYHPVLAVSFAMGGLLVTLGFYLLAGHANSAAGVSVDSVVVSTRRITRLIALFDVYFAIGVIASSIRRMKVRWISALAAHVSLLLAVLDTRRDGLPTVNVINVAIGITFAVYVLCWGVIMRRGRHAA
jgi:hypothetical protein